MSRQKGIPNSFAIHNQSRPTADPMEWLNQALIQHEARRSTVFNNTGESILPCVNAPEEWTEELPASSPEEEDQESITAALVHDNTVARIAGILGTESVTERIRPGVPPGKPTSGLEGARAEAESVVGNQHGMAGRQIALIKKKLESGDDLTGSTALAELILLDEYERLCDAIEAFSSSVADVSTPAYLCIPPGVEVLIPDTGDMASDAWAAVGAALANVAAVIADQQGFPNAQVQAVLTSINTATGGGGVQALNWSAVTALKRLLDLWCSPVSTSSQKAAASAALARALQ